MAITMRVVVELLGPVREAVGSPIVELELDAGATVADLGRALAARAGSPIAPLLERCRFAAGDRVVDPETPVEGLGTVVVIPPVSGG